MEIKTVKGFKDILGEGATLFEEIENKAKSVAQSFGYQPIILPTVEQSELFDRSIGNTTDIVEKEMFTFEDKGGRILALRPEMTASVARSFIEHHLETSALPLKIYYFGQCFRYENPQKGRYREFYQFGIEAIGDISPVLDVEVIQVAFEILRHLGIKDLKVKLNSIGCRTCRPNYKNLLIEALKIHYDELCNDCKKRLYKNPLRILDCKKESQELKESLPKMVDYLCTDCRTHFEKVKTILTQLGIPFECDPNLVRGLDYYSKTVFEVVSLELGAQNALLGGGRYDYLIEDLGGRSTPGVGFAMGIERLIEVLKKRNYTVNKLPKVYIVYDQQFITFANEIREIISKEYVVELDPKGDNIKKGVERASKRGALLVFIIGENEANNNAITIKNMKSGKQITVKREEMLKSAKELIEDD